MPQLVPPVLHPLVVHFPIVLIPLSALAATYAAWRRPAWAQEVILWLMGFAALSALVAERLGDFDQEAARRTAAITARALMHVHETLGQATMFGAIGLFAITLLLRKRLFGTRWMWIVALAWWLLFILVAVTAWYGGALVYENGVGVQS